MRLLPGYQYCCENDTSKTFDTPVDVAYGANGKFKFKSGVTGKITFDDATFGDPIKGVIKSGFYRAAKNQGSSGYSFAVKEGQTVAVPSLTTVAYGANGAFSYKYNPKPKQLQWRNSSSQERSHRSEPKQH